MAAIIPRAKLLRTVMDLKLNESGYIYPEGMVVKPNLECFIYKEAILVDPKDKDLSFVPLKIKRVKEGLIAFIYKTPVLWEICIPSDEEIEEGGGLEDVISFRNVRLSKKDKLQIEFDKAMKAEDYLLVKKIKEKIQITIKAG